MSKWEVSLFGKFEIERNGARARGFGRRKVQELLSYLLLFKNRPQARESLSETLWGDQLAACTRKNLRLILWRLRSALDANRIPSKSVLQIDDDWIQINPLSEFWLDTTEFEKVFNSINGKSLQGLGARDFESMQRAAALYKGDLLEGWYQEWCIFERERFQTMYLMLLDKLVQFCELRQKYDFGITYGMQILRHDCAHERAHRQLMRLYFLTGNRTQAIHQFERCVKALHDDLGVEPSERTKQLYEQIRLDTFTPPLKTGARALPRMAGKDGRVLKDILDRLEDVSKTLNILEHRVQEEIFALGSEIPSQT